METPQPKYSVCITSYNEGEKVRSTLESVLGEVDGRFEVVVTDSMSNDGSEEILRGYAKGDKIKLIQRRCSRGLGREIAFENARGEYIVSGIDADDIVIPGRLALLLDFYHKKCEGKLLSGGESSIIVAPAEVIRDAGGWRDIQHWENSDLCERAARIGKYVWTIIRVARRGIEERPPSLFQRNRHRYANYLVALRLRHKVFGEGEKIGFGKRMDYFLARASLLYSGHLTPPTDFDDYLVEYFVDSSEWWHRAGQDERAEAKWYQQLLKRPL